MNLKTLRLGAADLNRARMLFAVLADIFGEPAQTLSDAHILALLGNRAFWAIAAFDGDELIGGATAYALTMTRSESRELFVYDVAVRPAYRRKGVGSRAVAVLAELAAAAGIDEIFVLADNADSHALAFYRALGGRPSAVTCFSFPGRH